MTARSAATRRAMAALSLSILMLFAFLHGQLPWLGHFEWLHGAHSEMGHAWIAPLDDPALDEDRHPVDADLLDWVPTMPDGPEARLCRLAGPAFAQTSDSLCARYWQKLGPPHQPHDTIRNQGIGFSVWHGAVYFAMPADTDPAASDRRLALWVPWSAAALLIALAATAGIVWAVWPRTGFFARHRPALLLGIAGLIVGGAAALAEPPAGTLAWAALLLAATQLLPRSRRGRWGVASAAMLALGGFVGAEAALGALLPRLGLVPNLQAMEMLKYLANLQSDRPILLLVGSSYSQYGIDETGLETALDAAGHKMTVARLGFGGLSIPERLYYVRRYLAAAKQQPTVVQFEIAAYYDLQPLRLFERNLFTRREIAALDADNLRLSLDWVWGPDGEPSNRLTLTAELLAHFALRALQAGFLPNSIWQAALPASRFSGTPPKTAHFADTAIAADLTEGQSDTAISPGPGVPVVPSPWTRHAIAEEIGLFRARGVIRFGFYAPPSRDASEPIYARQFCRAVTEYPCIPAEDPALLDALGHDEDWLDDTHLQGPGRERYTAWLAGRLAASGMLP
jgi:hypothetical protein